MRSPDETWTWVIPDTDLKVLLRLNFKNCILVRKVMNSVRMENTPSIEKEAPLAEFLENWEKISLAQAGQQALWGTGWDAVCLSNTAA